MLPREALRSKVAKKAISHIIENAVNFNRESFSVKIREIGIGGSTLRTQKARDIDVVVKAEIEKNSHFKFNPNSSLELKKFIHQNLSRDWKGMKLDFHVLISNPSFSDRWIPSITIWNGRRGFMEIERQEIDSFLLSEFGELSSIARKIERYDHTLPSFFRPSITLLKSKESCELDLKFKNYLSRSLNVILWLCENREETSVVELNTAIRSEMKKFALAGQIYHELRRSFFEDADEIAVKLLDKFEKYGFSRKELISILREILFSNFSKNY